MKKQQNLDERKDGYSPVKNPAKEKSQKASQSGKGSQLKSQMIIKKCLQQNRDFKKWYDKKSWKTFHSSHYDWWAFPIDQYSSQGDKYKVGEYEISIMKQSPEFMQALQGNAKMVCCAWGYDLQKGELIKSVGEDQRWHNWPIRLYKMTKSLEIFGLTKLFQNAVKYGCILIKEGKNFHYNKRQLSEYFIQKGDGEVKEKTQPPKKLENTTNKIKLSTKTSPKSQIRPKDAKPKSKI